MKRMLFALVLGLLPATFSAQAMSPRANTKLAYFQISGGFRQFSSTVTLNIYNDGSVTQSVKSHNLIPSKNLGTLNAETLNAVKQMVANATAEELTAVDPAAPECMDAPALRWVAVNAQGEDVELKAKVNCKEYIQSATGNYLWLIEMLDSFNDVSSYLK